MFESLVFDDTTTPPWITKVTQATYRPAPADLLWSANGTPVQDWIAAINVGRVAPTARLSGVMDESDLAVVDQHVGVHVEHDRVSKRDGYRVLCGLGRRRGYWRAPARGTVSLCREEGWARVGRQGAMGRIVLCAWRSGGMSSPL